MVHRVDKGNRVHQSFSTLVYCESDSGLFHSKIWGTRGRHFFNRGATHRSLIDVLYLTLYFVKKPEHEPIYKEWKCFSSVLHMFYTSQIVYAELYILLFHCSYWYFFCQAAAVILKILAKSNDNITVVVNKYNNVNFASLDRTEYVALSSPTAIINESKYNSLPCLPYLVIMHWQKTELNQFWTPQQNITLVQLGLLWYFLSWRSCS